MSANGSGDEQSEDGELRQSPEELKQKQEEFSMSEEEGESLDDGLDIKPPQARMISQSRSRKREEKRSGKRSERHRDERYSHRDKHHREKSSRSVKEREQYQRDKERYYREKQQFEQHMTYEYEKSYRERKEDPRPKRPELRKHEDKRLKDVRDIRHVREPEKHRRDHYEDAKRSRADKALHDLRARLLSKRSTKSEEAASGKEKYRERRHRENEMDEALQGEAGQLVKEIISITTEEKKHRKEKEEDKLTEEEKAEQEQRREKLLEAEREMARLKEQSRMERERRHIEKVTKRKQQEEEVFGKRMKVEEAAVVTVSDASDAELQETFEEQEEKSDDSPESIGSSKRSRSVSKHSNESKPPSEHSDMSSRSQDYEEDDSAYSPRRSRTISRSGSGSRSSNHSSPSETSAKEEEVEAEKEKVEKKESEKKKIDEDLPPYYPAVQGCRSVEEFQCLNRIEEGTYGVVYRARDKRTDDIVALKRLKMEKEKEGFPITSLREINTLLKGQHPNIVTVREIVVGSNMDKIFIVMDYVEHDLKSLMETMRHKSQTFMPGEIKCLLKQLLLAVAHLHDNWILHRDLKTSNLLLSHKGILKVGDFGLAREYGSPLKAYTPIVVTLWYRAPELLLCAKEYSTPIDMWSVGCIFAELMLMNALFPGKSEVDQLNRIFKDLGTPSEKIWPGFNQLPAVKKMKFNEYPVSNLRAKFNNLSEVGLGLLIKFLTFDPAQRITAEEAMKHMYFNEPPLPIDPAMFPTWPAKSELGTKRALAASPKPPSGGGEYKKLGGDGDDDGYGFRIGMGVDTRRSGPGGGGKQFKYQFTTSSQRSTLHTIDPIPLGGSMGDVKMDDIEWNVVNEGHLLDAMVGHKPVGVNKYFQMAFICDKFTDNLQKDVHPDKIWAHLETMYNLEALDESESIPFPNSEREFALPEPEFGPLLLKKEEEKSKFQATKGGRETPKLVKDLKKDEKTPVRNQKEHRDSKEGRDTKTPQSAKKELKTEKPKSLGKGRGSKEERTPKNRPEETPKLNKRPTRGSFKSNDDSGSSGKSSPVTVTPTNVKRRRI